jgi:hypothetical protein
MTKKKIKEILVNFPMLGNEDLIMLDNMIMKNILTFKELETINDKDENYIIRAIRENEGEITEELLVKINQMGSLRLLSMFELKEESISKIYNVDKEVLKSLVVYYENYIPNNYLFINNLILNQK